MGRSGHPFEIFAIGGIQFAYSDFNDKNDAILPKKNLPFASTKSL